ncbi:hypothetical protein HJFPF1_11971 [Paramyrothecium foliicola]|nr:hypothetical protein HJFPF1_11971 [Paramyrothecium foliicola]
MALTADLHFDIASAAICATLILTRCAYRLFFRCRVHTSCHRQWRIDDAYMAFALLPLLGRTSTIITNFILDPNQSSAPPTPAEAAAVGLSLEEFTNNRITARKLIIPARICYALFLWSLKLCLLSFYSRFMDALEWGNTIVRTLRFIIIATFIAVLIATATECRPLSLMWTLVPASERDKCTRGLANLMTMAIFNILTDLALIILPFPILKFIRLDRRAKIQLSFLFATGFLVVIVTILRIPLILVSSVSQRSRSMWASIEILCACIVANTAFFLAIVKDIQGQHGHQSNKAPSPLSQHNLYLQGLPSSLRGFTGLERAPTTSSKPPSSANGSQDVEHTEHSERRFCSSTSFA